MRVHFVDFITEDYSLALSFHRLRSIGIFGLEIVRLLASR